MAGVDWDLGDATGVVSAGAARRAAPVGESGGATSAQVTPQVAARGGARRALPWLLLAALGGAAALVGLSPSAERAEVSDDGPAPLFAEAPGCDATQPVARLEAERLEAEARARWDRRPFEPAEGVRAVRDAARASACYEQAGARSEAARLQVEAGLWRRLVSEQERAQRLRLERAREQGDTRAELSAVRELLGLVGRDGSENSEHWLREERRLELELASEDGAG